MPSIADFYWKSAEITLLQERPKFASVMKNKGGSGGGGSSSGSGGSGGGGSSSAAEAVQQQQQHDNGADDYQGEFEVLLRCLIALNN